MTAPTTVDAATTADLVALWQVANAMAASRLYDGAFRAEEAYARILAGRDLGLSPSDAMLHMQYMDGKFQPSSEIQCALLKAYVGPDGERYDYRAERADDECYVQILRRDPGAEWEAIGEVIYTMADAKRAEITDSEFWRRYPRKMLFWRAVSEAIEAFAPQVAHPVQLPVSVPGPADAIDADVLPVASSNPAVDQLDGERPHPESVGAWLPLFARIVDSHEKHGRTGRVVEVLDAVGAPAGDTLLARFANLPDADAAYEVIYRLDRNRTRRTTRPQDGHAPHGQQGGQHDKHDSTDSPGAIDRAEAPGAEGSEPDPQPTG